MGRRRRDVNKCFNIIDIKMIITQIKNAINKAFAELNESPGNDRHDIGIIKLLRIDDMSSESEPLIVLSISINGNIYNVNVTSEGWDACDGCQADNIIDDIMIYVVVPIIFNYANI